MPKNPFESEASDTIRMRMVAQLKEYNGYFPTYREIMAMFGWRSTGTSKKFLDRCLKRGWITKKGRHLILNDDCNRH